jgi:hypothetical protein
MRPVIAILALALGTAHQAVRRADLCRILASPNKYDRRYVEVSGILTTDVELSYLSSPRCASEHLVIPNRFDASRLPNSRASLSLFRGIIRVGQKSRVAGNLVWLGDPVLVSRANARLRVHS